jgi:muramidase (phage lysozyme)
MGGVGTAVYDVESLLLRRKELEKQGLSQEAAIEKAQKEAMEASGELTDKVTGAQLSAANASKNVQSLSFSLAAVAAGPLQSFANVLERATGAVSRKFGVSGTYSPTGGAPKSLLDIIGKGESGGNYNALVGGGSADLTNMTVAQVQELQKKMLREGRASSAVGKYQMISGTLAEQMKKAGLDPSTTKFDQKTQDQLAQQLIDQAGYGKKDPATVMRNLAGTWAALPKDMSGRGAYDGYNTNQASVNPNELLAAISGPSSRYQSGMSGFSYNSAGAGVPAPGQGSANGQESGSFFASLDKRLAENNSLQRQANVLAEKQLKETRVITR